MTGPHGPIELRSLETSPQLVTYQFMVEDAGNYIVHAQYKNYNIPRSPVKITATQDLATVRVHGDGLESMYCLIFVVYKSIFIKFPVSLPLCTI